MVAVVVAALLFWTAVFTVYFTAQGVSPLEFFLGAYEPYDAELGQWRVCGVEAGPGLVREERWLLPDGQKSSHLEHQVRYRHPVTQAIERVEPTRRVPRKRSKSVRP